MNLQHIALNHLNGLYIDPSKVVMPSPNDSDKVKSFVLACVKLGFNPTKELVHVLRCVDYDDLLNAIDILEERCGVYDSHTPLIHDYHDVDHHTKVLLAMVNRYCGFIGFTINGETPNIEIDDSHISQMKPLRIISTNDIKQYIIQLLESKDSISNNQIEAVKFALQEKLVDDDEYVVTYRNTLSLVNFAKFKRGEPLVDINSCTDILRIIALDSGASLDDARDFKVKSYPRKVRKQLVIELDKVINIDDVKRHSTQWVKVFHSLHVGEYTSAKELNKVASLYRNVNNVTTTRTKIEKIVNSKYIDEKDVKLLLSNPGEFVRRLDKIIRNVSDIDNARNIVSSFGQILCKVDTKVILQLIGHFKTRNNKLESRYILTKGANGKSIHIDNELEPLDETLHFQLMDVLTSHIIDRYSKVGLFDGVDKVYIEQSMFDIMLPSQLSSQDTTGIVMSRGSKYPLGDVPFIRFFLHWKAAVDLDLTCVILSDQYAEVDEIAYWNTTRPFGSHSGDVRSAPDGGSEFIDFDVAKVKEIGGRYVVFDARIYSDVSSYSEVPECYVGFMERSSIKSGELYDPSTVKTKIAMAGEYTTMVMCVIDVQEMQLVWLELPSNGTHSMFMEKDTYGNRIEYYMNLKNRKVSYGELLTLHAKASNSKIVQNESESNIAITLDGTVLSPFDVSVINSKMI